MDGRTDPAQPCPTRTARRLLWRRLLRPEPARVRPHAHGQVRPEPQPAHKPTHCRALAACLLRQKPARVRPRARRLIRPEPASVRLARAQARARPRARRLLQPALELSRSRPFCLDSREPKSFFVDVSLVGSPAAAAAAATAAAATPRHGAAVQTVQLPPLFWLWSSRGRGLFA